MFGEELRERSAASTALEVVRVRDLIHEYQPAAVLRDCVILLRDRLHIVEEVHPSEPDIVLVLNRPHPQIVFQGLHRDWLHAIDCNRAAFEHLVAVGRAALRDDRLQNPQVDIIQLLLLLDVQTGLKPGEHELSGSLPNSRAGIDANAVEEPGGYHAAARSTRDRLRLTRRPKPRNVSRMGFVPPSTSGQSRRTRSWRAVSSRLCPRLCRHARHGELHFRAFGVGDGALVWREAFAVATSFDRAESSFRISGALTGFTELDRLAMVKVICGLLSLTRTAGCFSPASDFAPSPVSHDSTAISSSRMPERISSPPGPKTLSFR